MYNVYVKVLLLKSMAEVKASRWTGKPDVNSSPKGCQCPLYKAPIEKRVGDLQWRIVPGTIAMNSYLAQIRWQLLILPTNRVSSPFILPVFQAYETFRSITVAFSWSTGKVFNLSPCYSTRLEIKLYGRSKNTTAFLSSQGFASVVNNSSVLNL